MSDRERVCLGVIAGVHGVRGLVRLKSFTAEPDAITAYGPLTDADGRRRFELELAGQAKGVLLARIAGITDRDQAAALKGTELYVERRLLPPPADEDEFYHADLVGLSVRDRDGTSIGRVVGVADFGSGDLLEIRRPGRRQTVFVPFSREAVPEVDLSGGQVVIDPPPGLIDDGEEKDEETTAK